MAFITSPNPCFIKVILDQTLLQGKIDVPKKFVINNGGGGSQFHKTATLRLPSGAIWEVQVEKSGGKVSFSKGWPDFLKFYSIRSGYFIIFKFVVCSCFDVSIIDWSAAEIDYPINNGGSSGLARSLVVKIEGESDEETDLTRKKMKKKKRQLTVARRFGRLDEYEYEEEEEDLEMEMDFWKKQSNVRGSGSNHGDDDEDPESMRPINPRKTPRPLTENQKKVVRVASLFKCNRKNPSFMVTMRPSYIQTGFYLSLPRSFADRYMKESMDVNLELDDGRVWSMWCGVRWALTRRRTELKGGWKAFTIDNELHDGDICVFEWIPRSPIAFFKVTIFRRPLN